jgi:hypothetical protein
MAFDGTAAVPFKLPDGTIMYVEVVPTAGYSKVSAGGELPTFDSVARSIEEIGLMLGETMRKLRPKTATLSFGIEIQMEAGKLTALICKGSGKANLNIALEWGEREQPPRDDG